MPSPQAAKADTFRLQHHTGKLLILPNIWDSLSARLIEAIGYPSVATASVATALANGYADGEHIPFDLLLKRVAEITGAVTVPVTVDIERGFAGNISQLKNNIERLIENGAVGLNIEDGQPDGKGLMSIDEQCRRIEAIRDTGAACGVPVVINARTDIFLQKIPGHTIYQAIERAHAYRQAGADCVYPIFISRYEDIALLVKETKMPVNVNLQRSIGDLQKLEDTGVARVSLGPGLLKFALTKIKNIAEDLKQYNTDEFFSQELVSQELLGKLI